MRFVMWNGLEQGHSWPLDGSSNVVTPVVGIKETQKIGRVRFAYSAEFLLILIISLASAWTAANPFGIAILPDADSSPENSPGLANVA
jgi:hypothetical protein